MTVETKSEACSCPICVKEILEKLGISKMLLLKIQDPASYLIRVNGDSHMVGEVNSCHDGSNGSILGFSGISSCGHSLNVLMMNGLVPKFYLPA